jgi:hypothetical protein
MSQHDDENPTRSDSYVDRLEACDEAVARGELPHTHKRGLVPPADPTDHSEAPASSSRDKKRSDSEHTQATNILTAYAAADPAVIAELLTDSNYD